MLTHFMRILFIYSAFPHGMTSIYALILGFASTLLALSSSLGCYFVRVDFVFLNNEPDVIYNQGGMTMGLLSYEDITSPDSLRCTSYSVEQSETFDKFFLAAQGCALLANILLGSSVLLLICMSCVAVRSRVITLLSGIVLLAGLAQGLTLFVFFSSFSCRDCDFGVGAGLCLLGAITTFVNGGVICHIPKASLVDDDFDVRGKRKRNRNRPPTPRGTGDSSSTSSSEDEDSIPHRISAYDAEVVLVLPDGSKQVIDPMVGGNSKEMCSGCSLFPDASCS